MGDGAAGILADMGDGRSRGGCLDLDLCDGATHVDAVRRARCGRRPVAPGCSPLAPPTIRRLLLFADLTEQMDSTAMTEAGWSSHVGAVDEVVASLTDDERLELQRLLEEELAKS